MLRLCNTAMGCQAGRGGRVGPRVGARAARRRDARRAAWGWRAVHPSKRAAQHVPLSRLPAAQGRPLLKRARLPPARLAWYTALAGVAAKCAATALRVARGDHWLSGKGRPAPKAGRVCAAKGPASHHAPYSSAGCSLPSIRAAYAAASARWEAVSPRSRSTTCSNAARGRRRRGSRAGGGVHSRRQGRLRRRVVQRKLSPTGSSTVVSC